MAGAGYKLFQTGDVLTAAQVNTYLNEQTVMVFADAAARTTALTSVLAEGMVSYLQDTNAVEVYNGSAWVGVSGAGDVTEVQAGTGISVASGTGPIPVVTNTMATAVDAKGDLIVGTGADTFARLAVGTNGHTLVAKSSEATGLAWEAPASGSAASATASFVGNKSTSSGTYTDISVAATLTTGTKALVIVGCQESQNNAGETHTYLSFRVSGATTSAATDARGVSIMTIATANRPKVGITRATLMTGLTAGSNTFESQIRVGANTGSVENPNIIVIDMGS